MAAPPPILGALLLVLARRTRARTWRLGLATKGVACLAFGALVAATAPDAFAGNQKPGARTRWIHVP